MARIPAGMRTKSTRKLQKMKKRRGQSKKTSNSDDSRFTDELKSAFWLALDAEQEMAKVRDRVRDILASGNNFDESLSRISAFRARLLRTLQQLKQQATTCEPTITVVSLDGSSVRVPVKMRFVHAIGEDGNVPEIKRCSVLDLKRKLQEITGHAAAAQSLYMASGSGGKQGGEELQDDALIEAVLTSDGNSSESESSSGVIYLVVDSTQHFWHLHSQLVRQYRDPLLQGYRLIKDAAVRAQQQRLPLPPHTCHKVRQFLRGCRQVLKFLLERPETHKPRSVADALLIEAQLKKMIPVLSCLVASQHVDTLEGLNPTI